MDKFTKVTKCDDFRIKSPKSVVDLLEIKSIAENGIFEVGQGNIFTKTYCFSDINFTTASMEEQQQILEAYCRFLNGMNCPFKITVNNKNRNMETFRENVLLPHRKDGFDKGRNVMNGIIENRILEGKQGVEQERYITVRYEGKSYEDAKQFFNMLEVEMTKCFSDIGSVLEPLTAEERLNIIHDFYCMGKEENFSFDFEDAVLKGIDFANDVMNSRMEFRPSSFLMDDKVGTCLYIRKFPAQLTDRFLTELFNCNIKMICSVDIIPLDKEQVSKTLNDKYIGVQNAIRKQQQRRNRNHDFSSEISYGLRMDSEDLKDLISDVRNNDQSMFASSVNFVIVADNEKELKNAVETIKTKCRNRSVILETNLLCQREGINTVLPLGIRQVHNQRKLITRSMAALCPFNVQELMIQGGQYYGINQVSKNICIGNRKKLMNGNGFIIGVTGSGKSTFGKMEMAQVYLNSEDDIIVIDPKSEYEKIIKNYGGEYIELAATSKHIINPLGKSDYIEQKKIANSKGEITYALCEQAKGEPLTAKEKTIIERCLKYIYKNSLLGIKELEEEPTLTDLYNSFLEQPDEEAKDLAIYLERYVSGSFEMFAKKSNVDIKNRFTGFGMASLGKEMKPFAMLVMMEFIKNRIAENMSRKRATWLYIDEIHVLLGMDLTIEFLFSLWKMIRSMGGLCTGLTQNLADLLKNDTFRTLLENSEFVALLKQGNFDKETLADVIGVSQEQLKYVTGAVSGKGLIKHGNIIIPFDNVLDKDSPMYDLINTNMFEQMN